MVRTEFEPLLDGVQETQTQQYKLIETIHVKFFRVIILAFSIQHHHPYRLGQLKRTKYKLGTFEVKNYYFVDRTKKKMKLSLATITLIEAAKNGRGGKHGRVDFDNES